ncbi:MAG: hypothetical protein MUC65_00955 [Pontiellaceae bacterium]|jgi:hypothetical protein|nr:hypothetical protein [Pontiellaceae bacterium]
MKIRLTQSYYDRANENLVRFEKTHDASFLLYAALEFRMGIERYLFMWLAIIHKPMNKAQQNLYRARDLKNAVLKIEPEFILKLEFAKAFCNAASIPVPFTSPNLDELSEIYGQLGSYLHAIKSPSDTVENPKWWETLSALLNRTKTTLSPLVSTEFIWPRMNEHGESAYQKFRKGLLTYDALVALLKTKPNGEDAENRSTIQP